MEANALYCAVQQMKNDIFDSKKQANYDQYISSIATKFLVPIEKVDVYFNTVMLWHSQVELIKPSQKHQWQEGEIDLSALYVQDSPLSKEETFADLAVLTGRTKTAVRNGFHKYARKRDPKKITKKNYQLMTTNDQSASMKTKENNKRSFDFDKLSKMLSSIPDQEESEKSSSQYKSEIRRLQKEKRRLEKQVTTLRKNHAALQEKYEEVEIKYNESFLQKNFLLDRLQEVLGDYYSQDFVELFEKERESKNKEIHDNPKPKYMANKDGIVRKI